MAAGPGRVAHAGLRLRHRLSLVGWAAILIASAWLAVGTVAQMLSVGLFGQRPPLTSFDTGLRIVIVAGAVTLCCVRRDALERVTLIAGAAAAGSSALYGFGMRSPGLSAFRLLSHLVAYAQGDRSRPIAGCHAARRAARE
jgi:TRAP-type C4-dicarboxylate transport system permease small subunit